MLIEFDGDTFSTETAKELIDMVNTDFKNLLRLIIKVAIVKHISHDEVLKVIKLAGEDIWGWLNVAS